ncbi:MAG: peptidoglycan-binding protein [Planctomycetes bacterium]|nr:peptidoglycan-binding protein [Planctomycetota bacterium]
MVQSALNKAGYDAGPVDGKMGRKTAAALKSFQRAHDLKVTGSTTRATWRLLSKYLSK